jgi:hypothetical protein
MSSVWIAPSSEKMRRRFFREIFLFFARKVYAEFQVSGVKLILDFLEYFSCLGIGLFAAGGDAIIQ